MKVRSGFVANSSSSSYVCEVCHRAEGGYDISLEDVDMKECEVGHTFCTDEVVGDSSILPKEHVVELLTRVVNGEFYSENFKEESRALLDRVEVINNEDWEDFYHDNDVAEFLGYDGYYEVPSCFCPICTLKNVSNEIRIKYMLRKSGLELKDIDNEIKENFTDYEDFIRFMK